MEKVRSLLFVPSAEKYLKKVDTLSADCIIFDLEESIINKEEALLLLKNTLEVSHKTQKYWFVRINKDRMAKEIEELSHEKIDGFMIPKFEEPINLTNKKIIALIETPQGIINIENTIDSVTALAFGAEDYCANMKMEKTFNNLLYPKTKLLTYAKAYKKPIFDTPCLDLENYESEIKTCFEMGFDGKLAIHPKQAIMINKLFLETEDEFMREIVQEYEKNDSAILVKNGKVYENLHYRRFKSILEGK